LKKGHGGARAGAGRKAGGKNASTITKEAAREVVRQAVIAAMTPMLEAQIKHATGLKYLVTRENGTGKFIKVTEAMAAAWDEDEEKQPIIEVWEKEPSVQAFTDLLNRALDKPKEQEQEHSVSGTFVIKWEGD
jgi:hypothetical protein